MYKKILYVEDEKSIAEIYADILKSYGYEVELAFDGNEGLQKAQNNNYDLILLDLMLPYLSGSDILKILYDKQKSPNFNENTDVVMLTNFDIDDFQKQEILKFAKAYLIKVDTTPKILINVLEELSSKKQQTPETTNPETKQEPF